MINVVLKIPEFNSKRLRFSQWLSIICSKIIPTIKNFKRHERPVICRAKTRDALGGNKTLDRGREKVQASF
jgi:hypothetical protein